MDDGVPAVWVTPMVHELSLVGTFGLQEGSLFLRRVGDLEQTQRPRGREVHLKLSLLSPWDVHQTSLVAGDDPGEQTVRLVEMRSIGEVAVESARSNHLLHGL